jgi:hypothetical protein
MRSKTEWVMEEYTAKDGRNKSAPKKIGMAPVQASGIEYEFDVAGEMDYNHILTISKSRCPALTDRTFLNPGKEVADILTEWIKPPVWSGWKTPEDALVWAGQQLPNWDFDKIQNEFNELPAKNGKKAPAWVEHINKLTSF